MMKRRLHAPEGVRDIWGRECEKKHIIDRAIKDAMQSFGYEQIETPTFEYFDIFSREIGTIPSRDLYKFFDREGNTLVLRPDVTPSVARAYANYLKDLAPLRLFYSGNIYINYSSLQGRLRETTQIGAEYIGDNSIEADAELIALAVEALRSTGLSDFTISVGHVNLLRGLFEAYDFSDEKEEEIYDLVINKNFFGLEELLKRKGVSDELQRLYTSIGRLFDSPEAFTEVWELAKGFPKIEAAFSYFKELYDLLALYHVERYVSFELGLISAYRYYTGILFSGYTYGSGEAILKGGRYDALLSYFGCERPAIGFAILSDSLATALERQGQDIPLPGKRLAYLYTNESYETALSMAMQDRKAGIRVSLYRRPETEEGDEQLRKRLAEAGIESVEL
ncbi:MAG: ATP phosphoribosyltransferase regulatory subunit [Lachnospiraceae bacterium]|nr:ATP phosphoribosyltransferase regulatory subunit [Lachnospiraceae bacterium]